MQSHSSFEVHNRAPDGPKTHEWDVLRHGVQSKSEGTVEKKDSLPLLALARGTDTIESRTKEYIADINRSFKYLAPKDPSLFTDQLQHNPDGQAFQANVRRMVEAERALTGISANYAWIGINVRQMKIYHKGGINDVFYSFHADDIEQASETYKDALTKMHDFNTTLDGWARSFTASDTSQGLYGLYLPNKKRTNKGKRAFYQTKFNLTRLLDQKQQELNDYAEKLRFPKYEFPKEK
ncbi:hypothetical protein ccbrp13_60650 [Ktedonobacteria bacterium brp13]|nr:hypothetical protein ccbrp13_60650 [Ktedonobacteria bacterium brp13]